MDLQLGGKLGLVTGSTAGIGEAIARTLASEGAEVVMHGRNEAAARAISEAIAANGGAAQVALGDLGGDEGAAAVVRHVREVGPLDILIDNVGVYEATTWDTVKTGHWERVRQVDILSAVRMIQAFPPEMKERGWGRVIQIGSGTGHQPFGAFPQYGAAKAMMRNLTVSRSRHLRGTGVTANILTPGLIRAPSLETMLRDTGGAFGWGTSPEEIEAGVLRDLLPNDVGHMGLPEDVAHVAAFLASPLAGFVTGASTEPMLAHVPDDDPFGGMQVQGPSREFPSLPTPPPRWTLSSSSKSPSKEPSMRISENYVASGSQNAATPADVVRGLHEALRVGDVPGVLARLDPDVIVDEPLALPYGGVHRGRDGFVRSILGTMMGHARVDITEVAVFEGADGVVGTLAGTLTARTNGETFPLTLVELHRVVGGTIRTIDVYTKNPELLASFYARSAASSGASGA